jgi:hypothetical protein
MRASPLCFAALFVSALFAACARPDETPDPATPQAQRSGLPAAVFDACAGKRPAEDCSMMFSGHEMDGFCKEGADQRLVCAPSRPSTTGSL